VVPRGSGSGGQVSSSWAPTISPARLAAVGWP
jgi:hypothetical protein